MNDIIYSASVYKRTIKYTNFKGETQSTELSFALDPLQLLQVIATFQGKPQKRSGDPRKQGQPAEITDEQQLKFIRDLAAKAAGFPSEDGESWESFEDFESTIAGKAFMTKLVSSDADRKEFSEKVILAPFRAFVDYAVADESNSEPEKQQFKTMLAQLENVFKTAEKPDETLEERRARLAAELDSLTGPAEGTQHPNV